MRCSIVGKRAASTSTRLRRTSSSRRCPQFDGDLDATQRVARLGVVLKQLRPKCRAAVELRFTQGLSYREIAMHLGVSPQMAKKYVAQALGHCRRRMAALG